MTRTTKFHAGKILLLAICFPFLAGAQQREAIYSIDFVKILNSRYAEARYYYENNWKRLREAAMERKYIQSFRVLQNNTQTAANFDLMLITIYEDSNQYQQSEERFTRLIKELHADGPSLLNEFKPNEFRQALFNKTAFALAQGQASPAIYDSAIWVIDFVKIVNNKNAELLYFLNNNWKTFREKAILKKVIHSYSLLKTTADSAAAFEIMLFNEYTNSRQHQLAEKKFAKIIKQTNKGRLLLLNDVQPADFCNIPLTPTLSVFISPSQNKKP
jgi:hypothetical protein